MGEAFAWGIIAASSLLLGGVLALRRHIELRPLGLIMGFGGAGALISAVSYELVEDAFGAAGGSGAVGLGLFAGTFSFYLGDLAIDRFGGEEERCRGTGCGVGLGYLARNHPGRHPRARNATAKFREMLLSRKWVNGLAVILRRRMMPGSKRPARTEESSG